MRCGLFPFHNQKSRRSSVVHQAVAVLPRAASGRADTRAHARDRLVRRRTTLLSLSRIQKQNFKLSRLEIGE
eukprot:6202194-Pleurochrysis_carterae.AAC.1